MEHGCMVYTELAPRRQQFHVAPAMPAPEYITSVDIQKTRYKKLVTHVESHASVVSLLKRAENSSVSVIINQLLIFRVQELCQCWRVSATQIPNSNKCCRSTASQHKHLRITEKESCLIGKHRDRTTRASL